MTDSSIRFLCFPRTKPPPHFAADVASVFRNHERLIGTVHLEKGLTSDEVLAIMRNDLIGLGFAVEAGKRKEDKIERPVFFGVNGQPELMYEVDAYHTEWRCGLENEAGRAVMGDAIYRDLIQALVMVQVDVLVLAVPDSYKYRTSGRSVESHDYEKTRSVAQTLYSHTRIDLPYALMLIGY